MQEKIGNRWLIAIAGTVLQLTLGMVYAWSYFQKPIMTAFGWSNVTVMWIFSLAISFLGFSAAWGGIKLAKIGPRKLAVTGAMLWAFGWIVGSFAMLIQNVALLYIGYGVIGGCGLGLAYVTPVATAAKWFPDKKGFITGMVVMGFGLGAVIMSLLIAPNLMADFNNILKNIPVSAYLHGKLVDLVLIESLQGYLVKAFAYIGIIILVVAVPAAMLLRNPAAKKNAVTQDEENNLTVKNCIRSSKFCKIWAIFFLNITAGIMFIGLQSPMMQDLLKKNGSTMDAASLAVVGATLVAISSVFNGVGRFFWGGLSDKIGRIQVFRIIFGTQILAFLAMLWITNPWVFGILVCYVLFCYGGGFGTMPSFIGDVFTVKLMPVIYGMVLTAWSIGGIVGLQVSAYIKDVYKADAPIYIYIIDAAVLAIGIIITLTINNKPINSP